MKKASATIIYNSKTMKVLNVSLYVIKSGELIDFTTKQVKQKKYSSWIEIQKDVLNIAKNNGYYFKIWYEFGSAYYDINMIDIKDPGKINRYIM